MVLLWDQVNLARRSVYAACMIMQRKKANNLALISKGTLMYNDRRCVRILQVCTPVVPTAPKGICSRKNNEEKSEGRELLQKYKGKDPNILENYEIFNEVLVHLFRDIMSIEEEAIITPEFKDLTNNDMHVIEAIGMDIPKNMSTIAKELSVTVGTLTIAMNSLVKKGYVVRERGQEDRRVVHISLSAKGRRAYVHHAKFHQEMIQAITEGMEQEELKILVQSLTKLERWFRAKEQEIR